VFKIDTAGVLTVLAGSGHAGFYGDGGPATGAAFKSPAGLILDASGNLFIADSGNARVRKVDAATGEITTIAGNGVAGYGTARTTAFAASTVRPA
jgi:hypothetical protein